MPAAKVKRSSSSRRRQRTSRTSIDAPRAALSDATNLTSSTSLAGTPDRSSSSSAKVTVGEEEGEMVSQRLVEVGCDGMHDVHQPVNFGPRCYTVRAIPHHNKLNNSTTITLTTITLLRHERFLALERRWPSTDGVILPVIMWGSQRYVTHPTYAHVPH